MVALADLLDREDRACRGADVDLFFADGQGGLTDAALMCARCPIQVPCREYALERPYLLGYWGGTSADTRAYLRRQVA